MSKDNSDSFKLSRRKALASMGAIGAAGALGIGGTYAQFTDTEDTEIQFTAGGVDGTISCHASYNGDAVSTYSDDFVSLTDNGEAGSGPVCVVDLNDVKPGDFGCINFEINVTNNPAWVASCVGITADTDGTEYEPEQELEDPDGNGDYTQGPAPGQAGFTPQTGDAQSSSADYYGSPGIGEMAENMLILPYYDSDGTCTFFDPDGSTSLQDLNLTPEDIDEFDDFRSPNAFWSNSQEGQGYQSSISGYSEGQEYFLNPRTVRGVVENVSSLGTYTWSSGQQDLELADAPTGSEAGTGCVMLDGGITDSETSNNTQSVSPLQPASTINFGYDWHLPFGTGNEVQGDELKLALNFQFLQTRHTEAPSFNSYSPGSNTPTDGSA